MNAETLNELRQALSGTYSREIDRIISGQTTDKSGAENIKRIMDGLPVVSEEDKEVVQAAINAYRDKGGKNG